MRTHNHLKIVLDLPNILDKLEARTVQLEKWQKEEIIREIFDCMESSLQTFTRTLALGVSAQHLFDKEMSTAQISEINNLYMSVGMEIWFKCSELNLFKNIVSDTAVAGFIDTFPLFLEFVGPDYVMLTHNELVTHSGARQVGML